MKITRMEGRFIMNAREYQEYVMQGASEKYQDLKFAALALVGEVGEVCDVIKKANIYTEQNIDVREKIKDEVGDVAWQFFALLNSAKLTFEEVVDFNVEKLNKRHGGATIDLTGGKR